MYTQFPQIRLKMSATTSGVRRIDALPRLRSPDGESKAADERDREQQQQQQQNAWRSPSGCNWPNPGLRVLWGPRMGSNLSNRRTSSASPSRCDWPRPTTGHQPTLGTSSETSLGGPRGEGAVPNTDGALKGGYKPTMVSYPLIIK